MMASCPVLDIDDALITGLATLVDCHARSLGSDGYRALALASSPIGTAITGLLTLCVAGVGYRMILGEGLSLPRYVTLLARIGLTLAIATQWPAYQTLIYDLTTRAPSDIADRLLPTADLPGAEENLPGRAQKALSAINRAAGAAERTEARGLAPHGPNAGAPTGGVPVQAAVGERNQTSASTFKVFALHASAILFATTVVGGLVSVKLVAAMLLALGPLFAVFLLFDLTRGLFVAWARALLSTAVASVTATVVTSLAIVIVTPTALSATGLDWASPRASQTASALLTLTLIFVAIMLVAQIGTLRATSMLITTSAWFWRARAESKNHDAEVEPAVPTRASSNPVAQPPTRANALAAAVGAVQRRETLGVGQGDNARRAPAAPATAGDRAVAVESRLGSNMGPRRKPRTATSALRREARP